MDTRVYRGVSCDSDHFMVKSEIVFPFRSKKTKEPPEDTEVVNTTNYNLESLQHESTRTLYQRRLNEKLVDIIENVSVEEVYKNIIDSVQTAAKEALGLKSQRHSKELWWTEDIQNLIIEKKKAYARWLSTKHQVDRDKYLNLRRTTRRVVIAAKKEMWDRKCQDINTYIGGRKCSETWKLLYKIKNTERNTQFPTEKWKEHYENLLTESRAEYTTQSPTEVFVEGEEIVVGVDMVKKAVTELKNGRAPGPENIPAELIKCGTDKLFLALTWCMNKYINGVTPPSLWKVAYISSIHKKGNKLDCSNYRGISVTSTLS
ncbi:uncharacterized protein [Diabrotica undecimpunctata]|uniref:uncharacterized protein n=1 Tax=Diabrotica undecimpunctata TaxID=50387 RepID=UPI003B641215